MYMTASRHTRQTPPATSSGERRASSEAAVAQQQAAQTGRAWASTQAEATDETNEAQAVLRFVRCAGNRHQSQTWPAKQETFCAAVSGPLSCLHAPAPFSSHLPRLESAAFFKLRAQRDAVSRRALSLKKTADSKRGKWEEGGLVGKRAVGECTHTHTTSWPQRQHRASRHPLIPLRPSQQESRGGMHTQQAGHKGSTEHPATP